MPTAAPTTMDTALLYEPDEDEEGLYDEEPEEFDFSGRRARRRPTAKWERISEADATARWLQLSENAMGATTLAAIKY